MKKSLARSIAKYILTPVTLPLFLLFIWAPIAVLATVYVAKTKPQLLRLNNIDCSTQNLPVNETEDLVSEVSKLMALPQDEIPTIATVSDLEKARTQSFFKNAQIGDKVLVYQKSKKLSCFVHLNSKSLKSVQ